MRHPEGEDAAQERTDFHPTVKRDDPDRVEGVDAETDPEEHTVDLGDASDTRVQQPGE